MSDSERRGTATAVAIFGVLAAALGMQTHALSVSRGYATSLERRIAAGDSAMDALGVERARLLDERVGLQATIRRLEFITPTERIVLQPCDVGHDTPIFAPK